MRWVGEERSCCGTARWAARLAGSRSQRNPGSHSGKGHRPSTRLFKLDIHHVTRESWSPSGTSTTMTLRRLCYPRTGQVHLVVPTKSPQG